MLPGGGLFRQSLGLSRGVDEREDDECRLDPRVREWSLGITEALGGSPWVAFMAWDEDTLWFLSSSNCCAEVNSLGDANPVVRVLHKAAPRKMTGQGAPGMSWSTLVASLRLHGTVPRAQGQLCGQHVVAASESRHSRAQGCHC